MRKPDRTVQCPECLRERAQVTGKTWRCVNGGWFNEQGQLLNANTTTATPGAWFRLECMASGTVMPDGSLGVLQRGRHPQDLPTSDA